MKYFSGFCFKDEYLFFKDIVNIDFDKSDYVVCGFSFGCIQALEFALKSTTRIDKLILISPCFFNNKKEKFKQLQLNGFYANSDKYINSFLLNIKKPHINNKTTIDNYLYAPNKEDGLMQLEKMLYYVWDSKKLYELMQKGVLIEIYLGSKDSIIDPLIARDFFMQYGDIFMINNASHILIND